jgi:hypothetical protein
LQQDAPSLPKGAPVQAFDSWPNIQACPWIRLFVQPQDRIERVLDVIGDPIHGFV